MISTADTGVGLYDTLKKKILEEKAEARRDKAYIERQRLHFMKNDTFLDLGDDNEKELYAIVGQPFIGGENRLMTKI